MGAFDLAAADLHPRGDDLAGANLLDGSAHAEDLAYGHPEADLVKVRLLDGATVHLRLGLR